MQPVKFERYKPYIFSNGDKYDGSQRNVLMEGKGKYYFTNDNSTTTSYGKKNLY